MRPLSIPTLGVCLVAASLLAATAFAKPAEVRTGSAQRAELLPRRAGQVTSFAFDPVDAGVVYAGSGLRAGRVYRSNDGGAHWQLSAGFPAPVTALAADPRRSGWLYAATGIATWAWPNGVLTFRGWKHVTVYRTVNGGRSWQRRGSLSAPSRVAPAFGVLGPRWVTALAVDPGDSNVVFAGTGRGIQRSTDGGRSWHTVLAGSRLIGISGLAIRPTRPDEVYAAALIDAPSRCRVPTGGVPTISRCEQSTLFYRSVDRGKTWRATPLRQVGLDGPVALDAQRPGTLYSAAGFGVYREGPDSAKGIFETTDGGHSWTRLNAACPITAVAVDPTRMSTIYAGVYRGHGPYYRILRSTDSGRTWTVAG